MRIVNTSRLPDYMVHTAIYNVMRFLGVTEDLIREILVSNTTYRREGFYVKARPDDPYFGEYRPSKGQVIIDIGLESEIYKAGNLHHYWGAYPLPRFTTEEVLVSLVGHELQHVKQIKSGRFTATPDDKYLNTNDATWAEQDAVLASNKVLLWYRQLKGAGQWNS